jgi:hypothetical protein
VNYSNICRRKKIVLPVNINYSIVMLSYHAACYKLNVNEVCSKKWEK